MSARANRAGNARHTPQPEKLKFELKGSAKLLRQCLRAMSHLHLLDPREQDLKARINLQARTDEGNFNVDFYPRSVAMISSEKDVPTKVVVTGRNRSDEFPMLLQLVFLHGVEAVEIYRLDYAWEIAVEATST